MGPSESQMKMYDHMLEVIQAAKDGKEIESRRIGSGKPWQELIVNLDSWSILEYRVKPKLEDYWVVLLDGVQVMQGSEEAAREYMIEGKVGQNVNLQLFHVLEESNDGHC